MNGFKGVTLRRRILLVAAAGIIPVAIAAGLALLALIQEVERSTQAKTLEVTRIAAAAVNVELQQSVATLRSVSASPLLDHGNLADIDRLLQRLIVDLPGWHAITFASPDGTILLDTSQLAQAHVIDVLSFERAVATHEPVIGALLDRGAGGWTIAVRVPVVRDGKLVGVLTGLLKADGFARLLRAQRLPESWVMSVFDANGLRVARTREHERYLGTPAAPSLVQLMSQPAAIGTGMTQTLEGTRGYTAYVRLPDSHWSVALTIPSTEVINSALKALTVYGGGILASIALALLAVIGAARGINRPIQALHAAAAQMGRGEVPAPPKTSIAELAALGHSLIEAAQARAGIERERAELYEAMKRAAEERAALLESERAARNEAVRLGQLKDQFLATLSHELRTPLNSILGWSQILAHGNATEADRRRGLETIERNTRAQAKLIEDLLDMSRITSGKIRLDMQPLHVELVVESAIETARPAAQSKRLHIEKEIDPATPMVAGDESRLRQIVGNLLSNAIKFTPAGGKIRVSLRSAGPGIELRVSDSGQGIEPAFLPHLFERFRQADASITRAHGGLGLGLSIVRDLVKMHGGSVRGESAGPGCGATFIVELPACATPEAVATPASREFEGADLGGLRILAVDDEPDARSLIARVLQECGAEVIVAESAQSALHSIDHRPPDLVVSDVGMPGMDGYALLAAIRALGPPASLIPAIALTAYAQDHDRLRIGEAGFAAHLTKPVEPADLVAKVAELTAGRRRGSSAAA